MIQLKFNRFFVKTTWILWFSIREKHPFRPFYPNPHPSYLVARSAEELRHKKAQKGSHDQLILSSWWFGFVWIIFTIMMVEHIEFQPESEKICTSQIRNHFH